MPKLCQPCKSLVLDTPYLRSFVSKFLGKRVSGILFTVDNCSFDYSAFIVRELVEQSFQVLNSLLVPSDIGFKLVFLGNSGYQLFFLNVVTATSRHFVVVGCFDCGKFQFQRFKL